MKSPFRLDKVPAAYMRHIPDFSPELTMVAIRAAMMIKVSNLSK